MAVQGYYIDTGFKPTAAVYQNHRRIMVLMVGCTNEAPNVRSNKSLRRPVLIRASRLTKVLSKDVVLGVQIATSMVHSKRQIEIIDFGKIKASVYYKGEIERLSTPKSEVKYHYVDDDIDDALVITTRGITSTYNFQNK